MKKEYFTIKEIQETYPELNTRFLRQAITDGELIASKRANRYWVKISDLEEFFENGIINTSYMNSFFISANGFNSEDDSPDELTSRMERIHLACELINEVLKPQSRPNKNATSYGLKHMVERIQKKYISNGNFILAMILCGYRVYPKKEGPNVYFNVDFSLLNEMDSNR